MSRWEWGVHRAIATMSSSLLPSLKRSAQTSKSESGSLANAGYHWLKERDCCQPAQVLGCVSAPNTMRKCKRTHTRQAGEVKGDKCVGPLETAKASATRWRPQEQVRPAGDCKSNSTLRQDVPTSKCSNLVDLKLKALLHLVSTFLPAITPTPPPRVFSFCHDICQYPPRQPQWVILSCHRLERRRLADNGPEGD
jgi:hypothetical protein